MYDPAGLKVGATQEGVTAKTEIPGKAPAFRLREKEQALFRVANSCCRGRNGWFLAFSSELPP
jgi:hypothetical protein